MNRDAINELFDYTGWAWERVARVIDEHLADVYAKPMEGSGWPSIAPASPTRSRHAMAG